MPEADHYVFYVLSNSLSFCQSHSSLIKEENQGSNVSANSHDDLVIIRSGRPKSPFETCNAIWVLSMFISFDKKYITNKEQNEAATSKVSMWIKNLQQLNDSINENINKILSFLVLNFLQFFSLFCLILFCSFCSFFLFFVFTFLLFLCEW